MTATPSQHTNRIWLEGWGCTVTKLGFCILVRHPEFRDYNAIYGVTDPAAIEQVLNLAAEEFPATKAAITIYLPAELRFQNALNELLDAGFQPALRSESFATQTPFPVQTRTDSIGLVSTTSETIDRWIELYQKNYCVSETNRGKEHKRWVSAFFAHPEIRFYFIHKGGGPVGTAQIVTSPNGWFGIYSVSTHQSHRGLMTLTAVYDRLLHEAGRIGAQWVYFERLRPFSKRTTTLRRSVSTLHWHGHDWRILSSELGLSRTPFLEQEKEPS